VYEWISGYERPYGDGVQIAAGNLDLFRNEDGDRWLVRPTTILVDSQQLESGDGMSDDFKRIAAREIDAYTADYRRRYPDRDPADLDDSDLLREVMNTVGKPGKLGEGVKCVVSVSMLTEGWDVATVTHILGVRAFSTQLICEQVVGRALRRISYEADSEGMFDPEYAEVYGVPFSFIPASGVTKSPRLPRTATRVTALPERAGAAFRFPNVSGYRYDISDGALTARFSETSEMVLSSQQVPTFTESAPLIGQSEVHTLDDLYARRDQEVIFRLAKTVLERYFTEASDGSGAGGGEPKIWYFPQLLRIV
jgi:type III restriction enzyme